MIFKCICHGSEVMCVNLFKLRSPQQHHFNICWHDDRRRPTLSRWHREAQARGFGCQMRSFLGRSRSLRAGAAHVCRGVMGAPVDLTSKTSHPGAPRADVRLTAVHGEGQTGEVWESWSLTVAHHPYQRWGLLHWSLGFPMQHEMSTHIPCAREKRKEMTPNWVNNSETTGLKHLPCALWVKACIHFNQHTGKNTKVGNTYLFRLAQREQKKSHCARHHVKVEREVFASLINSIL